METATKEIYQKYTLLISQETNITLYDDIYTSPLYGWQISHIICKRKNFNFDFTH